VLSLLDEARDFSQPLLLPTGTITGTKRRRGIHRHPHPVRHNALHGSVFEFLRNAAMRAILSTANPSPSRIRNEFGVTNGGPVVIPGLYNGRNRTFYFAGYQGFRQVLGLGLRQDQESAFHEVSNDPRPHDAGPSRRQAVFEGYDLS